MGVEKVVYLKSYAEHKGIPNDEGVDFLTKFGVALEKYEGHLDNVSELV